MARVMVGSVAPLLLTFSCILVHLCCLSAASSMHDSAIERLDVLKKAFEHGFIDKDEYLDRKTKIMDDITSPSNDVPAVLPPMKDPSGTKPFSPQVKFLLGQLHSGLPRSYNDVLPNGESYWRTPAYLNTGAVDPEGNPVSLYSLLATQERTLTRYGLNLYDGATWEIALALEGLEEVAAVYEVNILYPGSTGADPGKGGLINIRADNHMYQYGPSRTPGDALQQITIPGNASRVVSMFGHPTGEISKKQAGAFFYRMIGPSYTMEDPLTGNYASSWKYPWPNYDDETWNVAGLIHWNDWKPITGENVWGAIIGPIQAMWISNGTKLKNFHSFDEAPAAVQLAISILPSLRALQSPLGSLYHCPSGTKTYPPDANEETNVSNENNFSAYAALKMLYEILIHKSAGTSDPVLVQATLTSDLLLKGLESWFSKYLLSDSHDGYHVIYQGGHVSFNGVYKPVYIGEDGGFAVDCQTWGASVLGQQRLDAWYGPGTAFQLWQATKKFSGYYLNGQLAGVGYTISKGVQVWSAEWTWGAISACERLAYEYRQIGRSDYAAELLADATTMTTSIKKPLIRCDTGAWCGGGLLQEDGSYLYANSRFYIPWGWYANPIASTCSTSWAVMHEHNFDPFVLGGGYESPLKV